MEPTEPGLSHGCQPEGAGKVDPATNRIAFVRQDDAGHSHLCTMHPMGNGVAPVSIGDDLSDAWGPAWSPDGQQLCFVAHLDTYSHLYLIRPDGSGLQQLTTGTTDDDAPAWSPDGGRIAFSHGDHKGGDALFVLHLASGEVQRLTPHGWLDAAPAWSPNGQWLAFHRAFGQPAGLYVVAATGGEARFLAPGHFPDLSPWGSRLAFVHADSLWVMPVTGNGSSAGNARPVTRALDFRDSHPSWSPDGRTLVFAREWCCGAQPRQSLMVLDALSGDCWTLVPGQEPDWGPCPGHP